MNGLGIDIEQLKQTALTEMENGQHKAAASHFDMVVIGDPNDIDAPFFRAYCNCFEIKLGEMPNAATNFTNAFCRYVDAVKALNDPAAEREKLDKAVTMLSGLVAMYRTNASNTTFIAPTVGLSISSAAKAMNANCNNKLKSVNANVSERVTVNNASLEKSNKKMTGLLVAIIILGIITFAAFMLWTVLL